MKVYNLENIKSATELKHRTEVISMNERSIMCSTLLPALPKSCKLFLFLYSISISKRL